MGGEEVCNFAQLGPHGRLSFATRVHRMAEYFSFAFVHVAQWSSNGLVKNHYAACTDVHSCMWHGGPRPSHGKPLHVFDGRLFVFFLHAFKSLVLINPPSPLRCAALCLRCSAAQRMIPCCDSQFS